MRRCAVCKPSPGMGAPLVILQHCMLHESLALALQQCEDAMMDAFEQARSVKQFEQDCEDAARGLNMALNKVMNFGERMKPAYDTLKQRLRRIDQERDDDFEELPSVQPVMSPAVAAAVPVAAAAARPPRTVRKRRR